MPNSKKRVLESFFYFFGKEREYGCDCKEQRRALAKLVAESEEVVGELVQLLNGKVRVMQREALAKLVKDFVKAMISSRKKNAKNNLKHFFFPIVSHFFGQVLRKELVELVELISQMNAFQIVEIENVKGEKRRYLKTNFVVGTGGTSSVYLAFTFEETKYDVVVLKCFRRDLRQSAKVQEESELLAQVKHPNIVTLHFAGMDLSSQDKQMVQVMEYVEGHTLSSYLKEFYPHEAKAKEIFSQIVHSLLFIKNTHGVVAHRDLKPENM